MSAVVIINQLMETQLIRMFLHITNSCLTWTCVFNHLETESVLDTYVMSPCLLVLTNHSWPAALYPSMFLIFSSSVSDEEANLCRWTFAAKYEDDPICQTAKPPCRLRLLHLTWPPTSTPPPGVPLPPPTTRRAPPSPHPGSGSCP